MTDAASNDAITNVESKIAQWRSDTAGAREAFEARITRARQEMRSLAADVAARFARDDSALDAALESLGSIKQSLQKGEESQVESKQRVTQLERLLDERNEAIEQVRQQLGVIEKNQSENAQALASAKERELLLQRTLAERADALQAAQQKAASLDQLTKELQEKAGAAQDRIAQLEQTFTERTETAQASKQRVAQLEQALAESAASAQAAQNRTAELEAKLTEHATGAESFRARIAELEAEVSKHTANHETAQRRIEALEKEVEAAKAPQEALERAKLIEQEAAALREDLAAAKTRADEAATSERASAWELEIARADLAKAQAALEASKTASSDADDLRMRLQSEATRANMLETRLTEETSRGAKSTLALQLAEALKDTEAAQRELAQLRAEVDSLRRAEAAPPRPPSGGVSDTPAGGGLSFERDMKKQQLGTLLLSAGHIDQEQLENALEEQRKSPQRHLGSLLVENGYVSEEIVAQALANQCKLDFVRLTAQNVDPSAAGLVTPRLVQLHTCIPIRATGDFLVLAMANPLDLIAIEDVERASGRTVEPVVATPSDVAAAVARVYPQSADAASVS
ncbi:MAG: hypothetical protein HZB26_19190 [Candidatus Hydrogenedentes bacterium]|nr:hypothetical protein [Candidatus Hydrogenedentota bacterium]